jgi:mRNA interferase MazF
MSQVMADKPVTIRRERVGRKIGYLDDKDISRLNIALAFGNENLRYWLDSR